MFKHRAPMSQANALSVTTSGMPFRYPGEECRLHHITKLPISICPGTKTLVDIPTSAETSQLKLSRTTAIGSFFCELYDQKCPTC